MRAPELTALAAASAALARRAGWPCSCQPRYPVPGRSCLTDTDGQPLRFTPHDFRKVGEDLAVGGMRRYLRGPRSRPARVLELADALRVRRPVLAALRMLAE